MKNETNHPKKGDKTRRKFIKSTGAATGGIFLAPSVIAMDKLKDKEKLALIGGPKAVTASHEDATTWPRYDEKEEKAVLDILRNPPGYDAIDKLEESWKNYFDLPYCKAHYNGTSAIMSMFFALDLPAGSEVMVPSCTFWATITPMRFFNLVPILVDIDPVTLNFDVEDAKRKLTKNTKVVFPVHYLGMPADMDRIADFCNEKGLILMEDACHAHGASMQGKNMGQWGRMAAFSFQASKPLPSIEGGIANYQNRDDYERATSLGHYRGRDNFQPKYSKYDLGMGMKLRMHPLAAVLARVQLEKLEKNNAIRIAQTRRLNDRITKLPGLYEQQNRSDVDRVYYGSLRYYLNEDEAGMSRDACVEALKAEGVHANAGRAQYIGNDPIFHETQWWHHMPIVADNYPGVEEMNKTNISLPLFTKEVPELVEQYITAFEKVWSNKQQVRKG